MREPVTLHVLNFIQGHHSDHWTEFILTSEGGDPSRPEDVISRVTYPVTGVGRHFADRVAADMDVALTGAATEHAPRGWTDHVSYRGYREVSES
jgi:hypothetical protein